MYKVCIWSLTFGVMQFDSLLALSMHYYVLLNESTQKTLTETKKDTKRQHRYQLNTDLSIQCPESINLFALIHIKETTMQYDSLLALSMHYHVLLNVQATLGNVLVSSSL